MLDLTEDEKRVLANVDEIGGTTATIAYWYFGLNNGDRQQSATLEQCETINRHLKRLRNLGLVSVKSRSPTIWVLADAGKKEKADV